VTLDASLRSQGLHDATFSDSAPAGQNRVGPAPEEIARGQFFDVHAAESLGIALPVEPCQCFILRQARFPNAARHGAFTAGSSLRPQPQIEEVQRGEALLFRLGQPLSQRCGLLGESPTWRSGSGLGQAVGWSSWSSFSSQTVPASRDRYSAGERADRGAGRRIWSSCSCASVCRDSPPERGRACAASIRCTAE